MVGRVAIVGLGYTPFSPTSPEHSYREMTYEAAAMAYEEVSQDSIIFSIHY